MPEFIFGLIIGTTFSGTLKKIIKITIQKITKTIEEIEETEKDGETE